MITIINKYIPLKAFEAMAVWPILFLRKDRVEYFTQYNANHENIHAAQQIEMLVTGIVLAILIAIVGGGWYSLLTLPLFWYWYGVEYIVRRIVYKNKDKAYRRVSYEHEAYRNEYDLSYLKGKRKPFAWIKYIRK